MSEFESLHIPQSIHDAMIQHAIELNPIECCGYLSGNDQSVKAIYRMTNTDNSPEHFTFDPKEQFSVFKEARKNNQKLLGVYHSHPASPARLSTEDIRLFNDPSPVYIIVSLMESLPSVKGFKVKKSEKSVEITQVDLVIQS